MTHELPARIGMAAGLGGVGALGDLIGGYFLVLIGYFVVHLFEHILAPHFHFGEETHTEMMQHHRARTVLFGLGIHTFFDGVAIAAGFLVSTWLGAVIFVAIFLHK